MVTRDVVSETTLFFNGLDGYASESVIKEVIELLEYPEMPQDNDISIKDLLTACQRRPAQAPVTSATRAAGSLVGSEIADDAPELSRVAPVKAVLECSATHQPTYRANMGQYGPHKGCTGQRSKTCRTVQTVMEGSGHP
jgi:hypothetical protein